MPNEAHHQLFQWDTALVTFLLVHENYTKAEKGVEERSLFKAVELGCGFAR